MTVNYSPTDPVAGASRATAPTEVTRWTDYADTIADADSRITTLENATSASTGGPTVGKLDSGRYYGAWAGLWGTPGAANGTMYLVPFWIPEAATLDRIGIRVGTAAASSAVRLGIYSDDGDGYPGALLLDAGTVDSTTTGLKEIVISQAVDAALYWFATVAQGGAPDVSGTSNSGPYNLSDPAATNLTAGSLAGYLQSSVAGALPANANTGLSGTYNAPVGFFKVA